MEQFNFPKLKKQYILTQDWKFYLFYDYISGRLYDFLCNRGVENSSANMFKHIIQLPKDTIISVDDFNPRHMTMRIIKFPNIDDDIMIYFNVKIRELEKLHIKEFISGEEEKKSNKEE